jgi:hypothetical protein
MVQGKGPYLAVAVICEKALQEQDGVLSIIRIIDRVTVAGMGPDVPDEMPPTQLQFFVVVAMKSGAARGRHTLRLRPEDPSGHQLGALEVPIHFEGEERGANVVVQFTLAAELEGLYWIDVLFGDDDLLTRIPLRVMYQPQRTSHS